jgi:hypothetical protein
VPNSHFSPGRAPHVGQRNANEGSTLAFIVAILHRERMTGWSILTNPCGAHVLVGRFSFDLAYLREQ